MLFAIREMILEYTCIRYCWPNVITTVNLHRNQLRCSRWPLPIWKTIVWHSHSINVSAIWQKAQGKTQDKWKMNEMHLNLGAIVCVPCDN